MVPPKKDKKPAVSPGTSPKRKSSSFSPSTKNSYSKKNSDSKSFDKKSTGKPAPTTKRKSDSSPRPPKVDDTRQVQPETSTDSKPGRRGARSEDVRSDYRYEPNSDRRRGQAKGRQTEAPYKKKQSVRDEAPVEAPEPEVFEPIPTFSELGLSNEIVQAITELGYESPTPIQARSIPVILGGGDLIGQAQTGTGKTAAFALPIIQRINVGEVNTQALILAPTRELAVQVAGGFYDLAKHTGIRVVPVYGGQPIDRQFRSLKNGAHIVVGTPGRILDHMRRGSLDLSNVRFCTLDEADEMMALGFTEDMDAILAELPAERQLAFFSATMPPKIVALSKKYLNEPKHISIESKRRTLDSTTQTYYEVPKGKKLEALARVLDMESPGPTIVFCRTRQDTNDLSEALRLRGYNAEALHGDMNQPERDRVLRRFKEGQADLLVATDVAARGLDIETVTHVVNYDIPWDVEQYIHRIGRTGRAGRSGDAITLVEGKQRRQLEVIERVIGTKIKPARIPTAADIASRRKALFRDSLREELQKLSYEGQLSVVEELAEDFDPSEIAAAALQMLWQTLHVNPSVVQELDADFEQPEVGMTRIFLGIGRQDNIRPGDIVGAIANEAGIPGKSIGVIDILDRTAFVEVPNASAEKVVEALSNAKIRGKKVKVALARSSEPQS